MKSFAVASLLLAAAAVAQPHGHHHRRHQQQHDKRKLVTEIEWVTETAYVTKLVDSTTTVWVTPGSEAEPTTTDQAKFIETPQPKKKKKTTTTSTTSTTSTPVYAAPEPTTTSTTSTSVYVPPEETSTSSTSVYVAPVKTSTSVYVAPTTTSEVYVAPTTSEVYVAPTTTSAAPAATTSAPSGGDSDTYSGDITYYDLGTNACGGSAAGEDYSSNIVALPKAMMGGDGPTYSDTPNCGRTITITANGKSINGLVRDKCMGCDGGSIDVSKKIFDYLFDGLDKGRGDCSWVFN